MCETYNEPITQRHECSFATTIGAEYVFGFWKGRVALYAILQALGIGSSYNY
jgi:hypothetical protein